MTENRKIVVLSTHESGGGAFVAASNFSRELVRAEFHTKMMSLDPNRLYDTSIFWANILLDRALKYCFGYSNPIFHSANFITRYNAADIDMLDADIANIHWFSNGLISFSSILKMKTPYILTFHDSWLICGMEHHPHNGIISDRKLDRYLIDMKHEILSKAKGFVFPSEWQAEQVLSKVGLSKPHVVIPNFCEIESDLLRISPSSDEGKVFTIGLVASKLFENTSKGGGDAIQLVERLEAIANDLNFRVKILIAGKASEMKPTIDESSYLSIEELGEIGRTEMVSFYSRLDCFVNLSHFENLSTTNIEAHASGVPVICYDVGGNSETLKNGITGCLVDENSVDGVVETLLTLFHDPVRLSNMREEARLFFIEKFGRERSLDRFVKFLEVVDV